MLNFSFVLNEDFIIVSRKAFYVWFSMLNVYALLASLKAHTRFWVSSASVISVIFFRKKLLIAALSS